MTHPNEQMIGLALGGGVARGFAHIGVLRCLKRHNINPGIVAGTSIGAVAGAAYLSDKLDELEEWALSLNRKEVLRYLDIRVRSAGLIGGKKLFGVLEDHFKRMKIEDLPAPFTAVATDLVTGHEIWLRKGGLTRALKASFALPGIFPPVEVNHRYAIDGALVNPVPVSVCRALGAQMIIAIDLNADLVGKAAAPGQKYQAATGFDVYNDNDVSKEDQKIFNNSLARRLFGRKPDGPSLFGVMVSSLNIVQDRITRSRLAGDPPDVHIKPLIGHMGLLEFERAEEFIREGELATERAMPEIKAAMKVLLPQ
jgi:NTE family protein